MGNRVKKKRPPLVKPHIPKKKYISKAKHIKIATNNLFMNNQETSKVDLMESTLLQDLGGQEIITIARHDLLTGQNVEYNIIKDLASAYIQYNPNNIISLQGTDKQIASNFSYSFSDYVPEVGTGVTIDNVADGSIVYYDPNTGQIVINSINLAPNQYIEVQFLAYDDVNDDTIYT